MGVGVEFQARADRSVEENVKAALKAGNGTLQPAHIEAILKAASDHGGYSLGEIGSALNASQTARGVVDQLLQRTAPKEAAFAAGVKKFDQAIKELQKARAAGDDVAVRKAMIKCDALKESTAVLDTELKAVFHEAVLANHNNELVMTLLDVMNKEREGHPIRNLWVDLIDSN